MPNQEQIEQEHDDDLGGGFFESLVVDEHMETVEPDSDVETTEEVEEEVETEDFEDEYEESTSEEDEEDYYEEEDEYEEETPSEEEYESEFESSAGLLMEDFVSNEILDIVDDSKEYDDSPEGLQELIQDNINSKVKAAISEYKTSLPDKAKEMLDFMEKYGEDADLESFIIEQEEVDYSKDTDYTDPEHQVLLIEDYYRTQGYESYEIRDMINQWNEAGTLTTHARKSRENLIKQQNSAREAREFEYEENMRKQQIEREQQLNDFKTDVFQREDVAGFPLAKKDKQALVDYITKPVDNHGRTQFQLESNQNEDSELLFAYLQMKGWTYEDIMKSANTNATRRVRKKLSKATDRNMKRSSRSRKESAPNTDYIPDVLNFSSNIED